MKPSPSCPLDRQDRELKYLPQCVSHHHKPLTFDVMFKSLCVVCVVQVKGMFLCHHDIAATKYVATETYRITKLKI